MDSNPNLLCSLAIFLTPTLSRFSECPEIIYWQCIKQTLTFSFNTQFASQWDQNLGFSIPDWIRKGLQGKTNCTFLFGISKEIEWRFLRISISYRSGDILNLIFHVQGKSDFLWVRWRWVSGRKKIVKKKLINTIDRLVL